MKKLLLPLLMLASGIFVNAQQDIFALTGKTGPNIIFNDFRALDVKQGISGEVFLSDTSSPEVFSQVLNSRKTETKDNINNSTAIAMATLAYDGENLIYMPLFSSNIYVLNSKTKNITLIEAQGIRTTACDVGSQFARMTAGYDGNIYALSNSGSQFLKISKKSGKYIVTDLGSVKDVSGNPEVSLAVMNTGFGGDMVADAENNFYVFSAAGNVFKISTTNLTSTFVGKITGLPENFSLNGAAVNANGKITVASAKAQGFYEVNLDNLEAKPISNGLNFPVYDLASKYFVNDNRANAALAASEIQIYPTRVDQKFINVNVPAKLSKTNLMVNIYDAAGTMVSKKQLSTDSNLKRMDLNDLHSGVYIVNVTDGAGKILNTTKILVTN